MGRTILITGSSGFLGQHIVRLIHERNVLDASQLVLFDVKPFQKQMTYTETIPQRVIVGDITKFADVTEVVKGVDCVIHTCGYVSVQTFPDVVMSERINVDGTRNLIEACITEGIQYLVYTSSETAILDNTDFVMCDETVPYPDEKDLLFKPYGLTKQRAEKLILKAHGTPIPKGGTLNTVALRPMGIYGEGESASIVEMIKRSLTPTGSLVRLSYWRNPGENKHQILYGGNAAWAHLCAMKSLFECPGKSGGEAYFVTDDTPSGHYNNLLTPFVHAAGIEYFRCSVPSRMLLFCLYIIELLIILVSPLIKINLPSTASAIRMFNLNATFSRKKLEECCGYSPIFSYTDSLNRCIPYYSEIIER